MKLRPAFRQKLADLQSRKSLAARDVIQPGGLPGCQFPNRARGDRGRNGTAILIGKKRQRPPGAPRIANFLVEAAVAGGRDPTVQGSADDRVQRMGEDNLFRRGLGLAIHTERIHAGRLDVVSLAAVEHKVGGKEDERNFGGQFGKPRGDFNVHSARQVGIGLAVVALAEGGAMNDQVRPEPFEDSMPRGRIGQVKISTGETGDFPVGCVNRRRGEQMAADESSGAGDQDSATTHAPQVTPCWKVCQRRHAFAKNVVKVF